MEMNLESLKEISFEKICTEIFDNYINVFKKVFDFKNRSGKYEYWGFSLVNNSLFILLTLITLLFPLFSKVIYNFSMAFQLLCLIPGIALFIRRLHDTGRSAWQLLFVPLIVIGVAIAFTVIFSFLQYSNQNQSYIYGIFIGSLSILSLIIYFIVITCLPSKNDNKYGLCPQENTYQKTLANIFIITIFSLKLLIAVIGGYWSVQGANLPITESSQVQMYNHIQ